MDEEPERENHVLVVALRIALVSLIVVVGILLAGRYLIDKLDLRGKSDSDSVLGGPVPVSPIPEAPSEPATSPEPFTSPSPQPTDTTMPTLSAPPAPTDIPPAEPMPPGLVLSISPTTVRSGETFTVESRTSAAA